MKLKMSKLNEELLRVNGLEEGEKLGTEPVTAVDPTYNDAVEEHKKIKDKLEDDFKEQNKQVDAFVKENQKTELKVKGTKEMKKMKLSESLFEDYIEEKKLNESPVLDKPVELEFDEEDIYYKKKRQPLADIIMRDLTSGEVVYRVINGKYSPTHRPSLNIDEYDIGANSDEHGEYICARVENEGDLPKIAAIARRYGKEFRTEFDKYAAGPKYVGKIYIDYEDWDVPYFDPDVKVRIR